jgi:hypothetical protein
MPISRHRAQPTDPAPEAVAVRRPRRPKDQKRIPLNLRVTPQMRRSLEWSAHSTGRSLSQQAEFLLEFALRGTGTMMG